MAQIGVLRTLQDGRVGFYCPGCRDMHVVAVDAGSPLPNGAKWGWNGSYDRPTFTPSVHVKTGHFVTGGSGGPTCTYACEGEATCPCSSCHSFVRDGQIQFLGDCTHALAHQTVPLTADPD